MVSARNIVEGISVQEHWFRSARDYPARYTHRLRWAKGAKQPSELVAFPPGEGPLMPEATIESVRSIIANSPVKVSDDGDRVELSVEDSKHFGRQMHYIVAITRSRDTVEVIIRRHGDRPTSLEHSAPMVEIASLAGAGALDPRTARIEGKLTSEADRAAYRGEVAKRISASWRPIIEAMVGKVTPHKRR